MTHVFISYVREDSATVDRIARHLRDNGLRVWIDHEDLIAGQLWAGTLRKAILHGSYFVACFTAASSGRIRSHMYEEVAIAIGELRKRPDDTRWFIPILLPGGIVPDQEIYPGRSLRDYHRVDLTNDWDSGLRELRRALLPSDTALGPERLPATRYAVGRCQAEVFLDLMGGGDEVFDRHSISFEYEHRWQALPEPIESQRTAWIEEEERAARAKGHVLFNGPAIRLHSFLLNVAQMPSGEERKRPVLQLRPTSWYDYVIANKRIDQEITVPARGSTTIRREYASEHDLVMTRRIHDIQLSNILTVSVVLLTRDGWTLIGRRTSLVENSAGVLAASAAENMHRWKDEPSASGDLWAPPNWKANPDGLVDIGCDYAPRSSPNPFHTVLRGISEEIGEEIAASASIDSVSILAMAWNLEAFNPHLYTVVRADMTITEVKRMLSGARASDSWEASLVAVPFEPTGRLREYLLHSTWAQISKGAVLRALVYTHGFADVDRSLR